MPAQGDLFLVKKQSDWCKVNSIASSQRNRLHQDSDGICPKTTAVRSEMRGSKSNQPGLTLDCWLVAPNGTGVTGNLGEL